jgi:fucose 4-O-acetylase-like acetyltransferase
MKFDGTNAFSLENRLDSLDIMKGIGILLVVLGHSLPSSRIGNYVYNFIYSFHMPLFFIVSGYCHKKRGLAEQIKRDFSGLLQPYIVCIILLIFCGLVADFVGTRSFPHVTARWFKSGFYGSYNPNAAWNTMGPVWFLIALFWCRTAFSFLYTENEKKNIVYFVVIPIVASYMFQFVFVHLYILQGLTAMIFYYLGYMAKVKGWADKRYSLWAILLMLMVWAYCILFSHIDMYSGRYDNFPVNVCGAIFGSYFVYRFAVFVEKRKGVIKRILVYTGKYSLIALCFHALDYVIDPFMVVINKMQAHFAMTQGHFYRYYIGCRFVYIFIILWVIPNIPIVRRLFLRK